MCIVLGQVAWVKLRMPKLAPPSDDAFGTSCTNPRAEEVNQPYL